MEIRLVPARENSWMVRQRKLSKSGNPLLHLIQGLLACGQIDRQQRPTTGMNDLRLWNEKVTLGKFLPTILWIGCCRKPLAAEKSHALVGTIQERQ